MFVYNSEKIALAIWMWQKWGGVLNRTRFIRGLDILGSNGKDIAICALHLRCRSATPSLFLRFCSAKEPIWNGREMGLTREVLGRNKGRK